MKIELGKAFNNKTWRFLIPTLRGFGDTFVTKFNTQVFKLAYGINDKILEDVEFLKDRRPIFILCDNEGFQFDKFLEWLKEQYYYITDYQYHSSVSESRLHMIVIEVPEQYNNAYDKFTVGLYSEMYTKEEISFLFKDKESEQYKILAKEAQYGEVFIKRIQDEFDVHIDVKDKEDFMGKSEWEFPYSLKPEDEIFNY